MRGRCHNSICSTLAQVLLSITALTVHIAVDSVNWAVVLCVCFWVFFPLSLFLLLMELKHRIPFFLFTLTVYTSLLLFGGELSPQPPFRLRPGKVTRGCYEPVISRGIPNVLHFIHLSHDGVSEAPLKLHQVLTIMAAAAVNRPSFVFLHTNVPPTGRWWPFISTFTTVRLSRAPTHIGSKKIILIEHMSDALRMQVLLSEGGVYLDTDVVLVRPLLPLLESGSETLMAHNTANGLGNSVIMTVLNSSFMNRWNSAYEGAFEPRGWDEASVFLPMKIARELDDERLIRRLPEETFFVPTYRQGREWWIDDVPADRTLRKSAYGYHLWHAVFKSWLRTYEAGADIFPTKEPHNLFELLWYNLAVNAPAWNCTAREILRTQ